MNFVGSLLSTSYIYSPRIVESGLMTSIVFTPKNWAENCRPVSYIPRVMVGAGRIDRETVTSTRMTMIVSLLLCHLKTLFLLNAL